MSINDYRLYNQFILWYSLSCCTNGFRARGLVQMVGYSAMGC